ncbi:MAG: hypothetical protein JNK02_15350 [Planctomycetes bacterium]|nr:hypothetical protein [Planctomycetota bacterium]
MLAHLLLVAVAGFQATSAPPARPADPEAERARAAFALLAPAERRELVDFLGSELARVRTFQMGLSRWALSEADRDRSAWPAAGEAPHFDPERHAPAQPIARHRLDPADRRVAAARVQLAVPEDPRAWAYDWGTGLVRRRPPADGPERAFELALCGLPPEHDLVRALVERALDDGSQRRSLAAFAHAYTDRAGNVYPGITLYDAWKSGAEIEMPDVDCLGIVNTVLDDWTTWTSIVPAHRHESLYRRIGELFQPAQRVRELRVALAATFLEASPRLCCGYEGSIGNFHALWEECASTPAELAKRLPGAQGWKEFLAAWVERCTTDGELYQRGLARQRTLEAESRTIRAVLLSVLEEYGAFARLREAGTKDGRRSPRDR